MRPLNPHDTNWPKTILIRQSSKQGEEFTYYTDAFLAKAIWYRDLNCIMGDRTTYRLYNMINAHISIIDERIVVN